MHAASDPAHDAGHTAVPPASGAPDDGGLASLIAEIRALAQDARTLAEAELAYQTSRAKVGAMGVAMTLAFAAGALVLAVFACFALVIGLLLGLASLIGPWGATAVVVAALLTLAVAGGLAALARWRRTVRMVTAKGETP